MKFRSLVGGVFFLGVGFGLATTSGCRDKALKPSPGAAASSRPGGLTPEESALVLAKVGGRPITLGDYAVALENMNGFDRLRYRSPKKRRELLQELIDLELLALEAKKRGLDKSSQSRLAMNQVLRDALLRKAREGVPGPGEIPTSEVRAYYDAHIDDYSEPQRRRLSLVRYRKKSDAEDALKKAKGATAKEWGLLVAKAASSKGSSRPLEFQGDMGIVGPVDDKKGANPRVPNEVRAAIFKLQGPLGSVCPEVISANKQFIVARLTAKTPAHKRSFAEAERSIRGLLFQKKIADSEKVLELKLKAKFPIKIDESALAAVKVPGDVAPPATSGSAKPQ